MITGLDDDLRAFAVELITQAASDLLETLQAEAPEDTGELVRSAYGPTVEPTDPVLSATIGFSAPQADWTDQGTVPHEIYPVNARALRFYWQNGPNGPGTYVFDHVNHPGVQGTGWFTDTVEEQWENHVQRATNEVTR